jgi:hypothetical protein
VTTIQIERRASFSPEAFRHEYLSGNGRPVIVTDALEAWPARRKWTFEYLKDAYGDDPVVARDGLSGRAVRVTKLAEYLQYVEDPSITPRGFWIDPSSGLPLSDPLSAATSPLYLLDWHAFQVHPELYADIAPSPYFLDDWVNALTPAIRAAIERTSAREYWSVYVGPTGSLSRLHVDFWQTHSYLAQIQGRKRCLLFSPTDGQILSDAGMNLENGSGTRPVNHRQPQLF